jgi:hypothetical protein
MRISWLSSIAGAALLTSGGLAAAQMESSPVTRQAPIKALRKISWALCRIHHAMLDRCGA